MGDLSLFVPELVALLGVLVAFTASVLKLSPRTVWGASLVMALAATATTVAYLGAVGEPFFPGVYRVDAFSQLLKVGVLLGLLLTLMVSGDLGNFLDRTRRDVPLYLFISALGMMMLMSATELLTLYVSLELSAYGLYVLAALHKSQRAGSEAAAKYILYGAASSGVTLYGVSLIYGAVGGTYLADVAAAELSPLLVGGVLLSLAGVLFKLAVFPFHAWAADTYQAAPQQSVTFIATASKVAAVGVLARLVYLVMPDSDSLTTPLLILCVASMVVGNLSAIAQDDPKRLLAYSTVAHAGYILIGLTAASTMGVAAAIYYVIVYVPIVFCAFLVIGAVGGDGPNPKTASFAGLYSRSPLLGMTLLVGMFALAGIPPTAGFAGKWFVFTAALRSDLFWLVLVGAANATVSLFYYLQLVKVAYVSPPGDLGPVKVKPMVALAAVVAMLLVLGTGIYPRPVWELSQTAANALVPTDQVADRSASTVLPGSLSLEPTAAPGL